MENKPGISSGILRSIKKLIFEDEGISPVASNGEGTAPAANIIDQSSPVADPAQQVQSNPEQPLPDAAPKEVKGMKLRVLELLEKLNEQGIDFFEVWNAAAEMGAVTADSIKAAYTSLKYVDKSLTKEKLLSSGKNYALKIQQVIDQDVAQKQKQKQAIQTSRVNERQDLEKEITQLETEINELQKKLTEKQTSLNNVDGKYDTQLKEIDQKISTGQIAVKEVAADIEKTLSIIEKNIN